MSFLDDITCTRIGRYSSGESLGLHRGKHPIAQFLAGRHYLLNSSISYEFPRHPESPKDVTDLPSRVEQFPEDTIEIIDVGCSTGGATLSFYEVISSLTSKKIKIRGYDNDKKNLEKTLNGCASYYSSGSLLHPISLRAAVTHFDIVKVNPNKNKQAGYINGFDDFYEFIIKPSSLLILQKILNFGDAENLPLEDNTSHLTLCTFVLRYYNGAKQEKIFKELSRITCPGGYIFTEEFSFQKNSEGNLRYLSPLGKDAAISFYNMRKILPYSCFPPGG